MRVRKVMVSSEPTTFYCKAVTGIGDCIGYFRSKCINEEELKDKVRRFYAENYDLIEAYNLQFPIITPVSILAKDEYYIDV